jgi:uncharacterized lipoprotein YddW (UPF0748 family)
MPRSPTPFRLAVAAGALAAACSSPATGPGAAPRPAPAPLPAPAPTPRADSSVVPAVRRELRGVWIAAVANIDWPSRPGLPADQQRAELLTILDRAAGAGMNAVIFHVRPAADAVYRSPFEPWAAMLTGTQGTDPGYDPLAFAVEEAHRRGLELHAWINPFRAGSAADSMQLAANHVFHERRDLVRVYGPQLWLDPGDPAVHDRSMRAILDVVRRYDVDAVHLDDYFYPYPQSDSARRTLPFPDSATYTRYGAGAPLDDWRRANVDRFVERLYREVHAAKPGVQVGISPFGIWRPGSPAGIVGLDAYGAIYADSRKWLQNGWVDYLAPQLYWRIDPPQQSFTALLDWWLAQNTRGRFVWPGIATYRVYDAKSPWPLGEIANQVAAVRARQTGGMLFYNGTTTLSRNGGEVAAMLGRDFFSEAALPPAAAWLGAQPPVRPTMTLGAVTSGGRSVTLAPGGESPRWWLVRYRAGGAWTTRRIFGDQRTVTLATSGSGAVDWIVVNAVDRAGNTSPDATWRAGAP